VSEPLLIPLCAVVWLEVLVWSTDPTRCDPGLHTSGWRVAMWYLFWICIYVPIASWWGVCMARNIQDAIAREMRVRKYAVEQGEGG